MQISGKVVHGKEQARTLGYPTANVDYVSHEHPGTGVWTCWMVFGGARRPALAVIGMWQLADGEPSLEVHVLDWTGDLYDQTVVVHLGEHLRSLETFESVEALKQQIVEDVSGARKWFTVNL